MYYSIMKNSSLLVLGVLALVGCPSKPAPPPNVPDAQPTSPVASTTPADAGADQKSSTDQQVTNVVVNEPAPTIEVFFSPNGGCAEKIVARIAAIQPGGTIRMLAYGFTSKDISDAMIAAKKRGVDVQAVFDKSDKSTQGSKSRQLSIPL